MSFVSFVESLSDAMEIGNKLFTSIVVDEITESSMQCFRLTISETKRRIQVISFTQYDKATYSAFPDDTATILCDLEFQNIGALLTAKTNPFVDLLVDLHPLQSASTPAHMVFGIISV